MKKFVTKALAGIMTLAVVASSVVVADPTTASAKVNVKKIKVSAPSGKTAYVAKGKKVKLTTTVTVKPNKKANKNVTYVSANKKIATVTGKGVIKGKKVGKTKITVTSKKNKKKKATIKVVVKKDAIKKVKINSSNFTLSVGGKKTLKATATPKKNTCTKVVWSTSKKSVATVSSKGVVTAKKEGTAKITATAADGSGKKASVTVTVGAGIASVTAVTSKLLRVTLTGKKALTASNFAVQTRNHVTSTKYITKEVTSATTTDQKVYNVYLEDTISEGTYVKVTISALAGNKSVEAYIENISGYGNAGNEEVEYVTANKDKNVFSDWYNIYNTNAVGTITYTSLTGLPAGLKAYFSKDRTSVRVRGQFATTHKGTTAVLTGTDEKGTVFTKKIIYVVGSDTELVAVVKPTNTQLSYRPDDPKTAKDEESGLALSASTITRYVYIAGGSDAYSCVVTYNGQSINKLIYSDSDEDGYYYNRKAIPAGTYSFAVAIEDSDNEALKTTATVTLNLQDGVTVSGTVRDAAGQPVRRAYVCGYTKDDAYGRHTNMEAVTEADGTYSTRVIPGDYYTYCSMDDYDDEWYSSSYDGSAGNNFAAASVKNFTIPLNKVTFVTNISGAVGYGSSYTPQIIDAYGNTTTIKFNSYSYINDFSMYAYLKPGSYEILGYPNTDDYKNYNTIYAYSKIEEYTDFETGAKRYYTSESLGRYKVSGAFTVSGNSKVTLNATKVADSSDD